MEGRPCRTGRGGGCPQQEEWDPCWLLCSSCWNSEWGRLRSAAGESSSMTLPACSTSTRSELRIVLSLCERGCSVAGGGGSGGQGPKEES